MAIKRITDTHRYANAIELIPSGAYTADQFSNTFDTPGTLGGHFIINVTSITGAPEITPTISAFVEQINLFYPVLIGVVINSVGTTVLKIHPGISPVLNGSSNDILPPVWDIGIAHANADSITYSVHALLGSG